MFQDREERRRFLHERRQGIGGSDIAAICGFHPYKDAMDVYLEKTRPVTSEDVDLEGQNIHLWRGILLEHPLRQLFEFLYDRPVQQFQDGNLKVHPDHEWVRAHLDGRQVSTGDHPFETTGAWEAKAPSTYGFKRIVEAGLEPYRIAQIQWELYASGYDWGTVAIGNLEDDRGPMIMWDMEPYETLINRMHERGDRFWHEHVLEREAPDLEEWGDTERVEMPEVDAERVTVTDDKIAEATRLLMDAYEVRSAAKDLYKRRKEAYQDLLEELGLEKVQVPGQGKVNYGWRSGRTNFDDDKLRKARPLDVDKVIGFIEGMVGPIEDEEDLESRLIEGCEIDYDQFEEQYDDYRSFRPYPASDRGEDDE